MPLFHTRASAEETLEQIRQKLLAIDQYAWIDLAFVSHVTGEGGQRALEDSFVKNCLPSSKVLLSLPFCVQASKGLQESDLYVFAGSAAQGSIVGAHALLSKVEQGLPLTLDRQATPFMQKVFCQMQHFIVHAEKGEITYDDQGRLVQTASMGEVISGAPALKKCWQDVESKEASNLTLGRLEPLVIHGHLLSEEDRKKVHAKVEEILKLSQGQSKAVKVRVPAKGSGATTSKRKASNRAEGEDPAKAAKGLFS